MFGWKTTGLSLGLLLTSCGGTDPEAEPLAVPSLQVDSQRVDVGSARLRETTEQEVVLRNTGDLAMGVRAIKTDGAPFSVVVVDGEAWAEAEEDGAYRIPAGGALTLQVAYAPESGSLHLGTLSLETIGKRFDGSFIDDAAAVYADPRRPRFDLGLRGMACGDGELTAPREVDFGAPRTAEDRTARVGWFNGSDAIVEVTELTTRGCDDVSISLDRTLPSFVTPGDALGAVVTLADGLETPIDCVAELSFSSTCEDGVDQVSQARFVSNPAAAEPLTLEILSPASGSRVPYGSSFEMVLEYHGSLPLDDQYCKVRSLRQGAADGRPTIADCSVETDSEGRAVVLVPTDFYLEAAPEVLVVQLVDEDGKTHQATVALRIGAEAQPDDLDGDGFGTTTEPADCDDSNPDVYPLAIEVEDGLDTDCDPRTVDPSLRDDDGDGISVGRGDCDDQDPATFPGQDERRDGRDNDCDGLVDEDTPASDDDHDGFTELQRDCDDDDPSVPPGAIEICGDRVDNDCDQIPDVADPGGCAEGALMQVGPVLSDRTAVSAGEEVELYVLAESVFGGDPTSVTWEADSGTITPLGLAAVWTAPARVTPTAWITAEVEADGLTRTPAGLWMSVVEPSALPDTVIVGSASP